ncbi:MAG TPA: TIM barrel protein, partial [Terracidiphilus sp.]|nr:TIM barrel protein [Terracidiphilus sp.]
EHLGAFARPLGVRLVVENLLNEATTPDHVVAILEGGHLPNIGVCLDLGHAHMSVGIGEAVTTVGDRIASVHAHDNHGQKDEHLWPGDGTINWTETATALRALAPPPAIVLEPHSSLDGDPADLQKRITQAFALFD